MDELIKKYNIKIHTEDENKMNHYRSKTKKLIEEVKEHQETIRKLTALPKEEIENLQKSTLFASLQSSTGIQSEQLDASMRTNMELEKHVLSLERDNLRLMSILKSYGYEESDQQRELLLADYTPPASLKLSRQLDVIMMMNGMNQKEQKLAADYVDGKVSKEEIEHLAKKFILKTKEEETKEPTETEECTEKTQTNSEDTQSNIDFRLVEKPTPTPFVKL